MTFQAANTLRLGTWSLALAAVGAACAGLPADDAENARGSPAPRGGQVATAGTAATLESIVSAVRADAAGLLQRPIDDLPGPVSEPVTWGDGSLGCPMPGRLYTQALVPGWLIVVREGGRELRYHASQRGQWLLCPAGRAQRPLPGEATR